MRELLPSTKGFAVSKFKDTTREKKLASLALDGLAIFTAKMTKRVARGFRAVSNLGPSRRFDVLRSSPLQNVN